MRLETRFGTYENCFLVVNRYSVDGTPAIAVWNEEDGPIATLTKCLDLNHFPYKNRFNEKNTAFVDMNNLPEAMEFISEYELGKATGAEAWSGYCRYPLVEFDMEQVCGFSRNMM